jgi:hypothetical protein
MIDFAKWSEAAWQALGYPPGTFEGAYRQNRALATDDAIDADVIAGPLINLIDSTGDFTGTATTLLTTLEQKVWFRDRRWPKDATRWSTHLRRLRPARLRR